jgi:hypothetical protein
VEQFAPDHYGLVSTLDLFDDLPHQANQNSSARARREDRFSIYSVFSQTWQGKLVATLLWLFCFIPFAAG